MRAALIRSFYAFSLLSALLAGGCSSPRAVESGSSGSSAMGPALPLPLLVLDTVTNNPGLRDLRLSTPIAVGPQGDLLFVSLKNDTTLQLLHHVDGDPIRFARKGDGPGEITNASPIFVSETTVVVVDNAVRISSWTRSGVFVVSTLLDRTVSPPIAHLGDDRWLGWRPSHSGVQIVVAEGRSGNVSELVPTSDSFLAARYSDEMAVLRNPPALGTWQGGVAVADRRAFAIGLYDRSGTRVGVITPELGPNLPTEAEAVRLLREWQAFGRPGGKSVSAQKREIAAKPLEWFGRRIRMDALGRMWLVGTAHDSVFAYLYSGTRSLGRLEIPCHETLASWDLNGNWFAIVCTPDDPAVDDEAVVKLFRVVER